MNQKRPSHETSVPLVAVCLLCKYGKLFYCPYDNYYCEPRRRPLRKLFYLELLSCCGKQMIRMLENWSQIYP
jgi:hypothetical protein